MNPVVNALVSLRDPDALMAEARAADAGPRRGWLHGLPFAVKDLQGVAGIRSTSGSRVFADHVPEADDLLPARLRAAGAILVAKTNVPEFGLGSHSFNPVFGATGNPYDPALSAGGSSGGAAAALAARMVPVADGSDMMGSLRNPAAFCNVYGLRPTFGLVPRDPVGETFLAQLSTDGPMARCPEDLARLLAVLAEALPANPHQRAAFSLGDALAPLPGPLRIGWLGDWGGAYAMEPGILALCEAALADIAAMGHRVEALAPPFPAAALWDSWTVLRSFAIAGGLAEVHEAHRDRLKPEALWEIERGLALSAMEVHRASVIRSDWYATIARLFEAFDALVLPSAQVWPFPKDWRWPRAVAGRTMDGYHRWMEVVVPASLAGLPALAMPAGFGANGLAMGMQVIGPRGSDAMLLALAQQWHAATDWPGQRVPFA